MKNSHIEKNILHNSPKNNLVSNKGSLFFFCTVYKSVVEERIAARCIWLLQKGLLESSRNHLIFVKKGYLNTRL
jgi:hypothetical protein